MGRPPARLPSGRHALPRELVVDSQRKRILDAVAEVCAERGYAAATVGDIVLRAGVSRGTFYELFRDKEDAFLAAGREILAETMTVVSEAYAEGKPELEALRDGMAAILDFLASQPAYASVTFLDSRASTPAAVELYRSGARGLVALLERSARSGEGDQADLYAGLAGGGAPSQAGRAALGGAEAIVRREIAAGRVETLPALLPELIYCALVPFLGQQGAFEQQRLAREDFARRTAAHSNGRDPGEGVAAEA